MEAVRVPLALRGKLGDAGALALEELIDDAGQQWRQDVVAVAAERFEHRLSQELSATRVEMARGLGDVRGEIATCRVEWLRWSFLFWIGQVAVMAGVMALLLRTIGRG